MDAAEALALTERIHARLVARRGEIEKRENYYLGKQPLAYATREWRRKAGSRYDGFSDNWCRPVVDAEAERIKHIGLTLQEGGAGRELWRHWMRNEMEMQSSQGWLSSLIAGRSFVTVWGDEDDQPAIEWQHAGVVEIEYDPSNPRKKVAMVKSWLDDKYEYATLYTRTEVFKWRREAKAAAQDGQSQARQIRSRLKLSSTRSAGWQAHEVSGEVWPLPNPLGEVPAVEMPNRPLLAADPVSEITGVMAMQDAINLLWAYMFLGADYASLPARVVMGQGPPKMPVLDSTGQKIGERNVSMDDLQEKRLLYLSSENAKIGQYDAAKLDVFTDVIEVAVGHVAAQTRTPPTYLVTRTGMSNVNGTGIKASEIGLVNKVQEFQTFVNPALREMYRLVALAGGDVGLAEQARFASIAWADAEIRSDAEMADALMKKRAIGYPFEYLLELDGKAPEEVDRILEMRRQEAFDPQIESALRSFDQQAIDAEVVDGDSAGNI